MRKKTVVILLAILLTVSGFLLNKNAVLADDTGGPETQAADSLREEGIIPYSSLLPGEAVVNNYQELKNVLESDNGITAVYFGADITMQLGGIKINPNKRQLSISGLNPLEPGQTEPYTLTDYSSSSFYSTIYIDIDAVNINTLIVHDMNIVGKNYYGPFSVYDSSALAGIVLIYERVNYNGPQLGYHRKGTIRIEDCKVKIHGGNGGSLNQEFSEAKNLVFKGANTIDTDSSANTIFWHPLGGSFTLADNASLVVTSPNTSAVYGVFYADLSLYKVEINIGERARLDMTISGTVAPDAYVALSGLTVREAGEFHLKTTKGATDTVLKISGALTIEKEAKFIISGYGGASYSLLRQEGGDITVMEDAVFQLRGLNAYAALLNLVGRAFICDDPSSILLYNANRDIMASSESSRIYINAQQVNYWDTLIADTSDVPAAYRWNKTDGSNFLIDGRLSTGSTGNFSELSSNYESGDPPGVAPDASNFSMAAARVLAFGRLELTVVRPAGGSTVISGFTKPGAMVRVLFSQLGEDYILPEVTADSMGIFHITADVELKEDTVVTVKSRWQFLSETAEVIVSGGGKLEFFVPESMEFFITGLSASTQIIKRLHAGWEIIVSDGRGAGGGWSIYARLYNEMTPDNAEMPALVGALIYIDDSGVRRTMSTEADVLIASRSSSYDEEVLAVSWDEDKGVLLSVEPGTAFTGTVYSASIMWTLIDAP